MANKVGRPKKKLAEERLGDILQIAEQEIAAAGPGVVKLQITDTHAPAPGSALIRSPERIAIDVKDDYEFARSNLYNLAGKATEAINGILELAVASEHPRVYEVAGNLINIASEVTAKIIGLQKQMKELEGSKDSPTGPAMQSDGETDGGGDKYLFIGASSQLLDMMKKLEKEDINTINGKS